MLEEEEEGDEGRRGCGQKVTMTRMLEGLQRRSPLKETKLNQSCWMLEL